MRTFVIGDIHGCLDLFEALIARLEPTQDDHIVLAGDLLDKGPDPVGVVRRARALAARTRVSLVLGNHEDRHARFRRHEAARTRTGRANPVEATDELRHAHAHLDDADIAFLASGTLHLALPEHGAVVVHAGIPPSVDRLPSERDLAAMPRDVRKRYDQLLRVRHVDTRGWMVPLGQEGPHTRYWAETYDGRFGHVYFGHEPFVAASEPVRYPHATGLDLGACFGNRLAAVVLVGQAAPVFVTVPATRAWAHPLSPRA
jgi:serine/threonine protein phosphatase 1